MTKISSIKNIIGKHLVCACDASIVGVVVGINFDNSLKANYVLIDSTNLEQNLQVKFVSLKSIWNIGDILLIKNQNDIKYSWNTLNPKLNFPLHAKVYCQSGFYHGDVIDFELKNYKISQLHTTNNIANYNILSISKDIIIINTTNKNIVLNKKKRISQKIALPNVVELDTKL